MTDIYIKGNIGRCSISCEDLEHYKIFQYKDQTRNQCEWFSIVEAMQFVHDSGDFMDEDINFYTDSIMLDNQLNWRWHVKSKKIKHIYFKYNKLKNLLRERKVIKYNYVESKDNPARRMIYDD